MQIELDHRSPFDLEGLLGFLGRRAVPGIEEVRGGIYRRSMRLAGGPALVELAAAEGAPLARLQLTSDGDGEVALARVRALLDLDTDPTPIVELLSGDGLIGSVVRDGPGRRVPGHVDPAELAIRAVIGQQVSLEAAATIAGRLVSGLGEPLSEPVGAVTHLFPESAAIAVLAPEDLPMPRSRGRALIGLAAALADGSLTLDPADRASQGERLMALPGIGPWTASYVEMRALGNRDAFLPTDLGVRRALERLGEDGSPHSAARLAERWRPYRAYALQHLWSTLE